MRVLFFQISTSCSKPTLKLRENLRAILLAISSSTPGSFLTITAYCSTKEFASIG